MAITQVIQNGKLVDTSAAATSSSTSSTSGSNLDKEAFLQLLVAQMKYQDPLEPTDNTEYVAQLATFSQLEATQNLEDTFDKQLASSLVGKEVILNTTDKSGNQSYIHGTVDYVMYENGKIYLSVNDGLYSLDDLDTVVSEEYYQASTKADAFSNMIAKLPSLSSLTVNDASAVAQARAYYNAMNSYEQGFVPKGYIEALEKIEEKLAMLQS